MTGTRIKGKKVIIGLSGGVDSAVAALLLKKQGAIVEAIHMTNWEDDKGVITNVPRTAVVCEEKDKSYDVFMDGNLWTINKTCTYYLEEQHAS